MNKYVSEARAAVRAIVSCPQPLSIDGAKIHKKGGKTANLLPLKCAKARRILGNAF
jgi:hypothetical protein